MSGNPKYALGEQICAADGEDQPRINNAMIENVFKIKTPTTLFGIKAQTLENYKGLLYSGLLYVINIRKNNELPYFIHIIK